MIRAGSSGLLLLLSMVACRPSGVAPEPAPDPGVAPAATSARVEPIATLDAGAPALVSFAHPPADARWVRAIRRARHFRHLTLDGAGAVRLAWVRDAEKVDEGEGAMRAPVRLVLERDGHVVFVGLGDLFGEMEPASISFCARAGYRSSDGSRLDPPRIDGFVSAASVGGSTGDAEFLVVLSGATLHVLDRQTSDGMCESEVNQGPMTVCRGEEYVRTAEIRLVTRPTSFEESVAVTTDTELGSLTTHPLDCAAATMQAPLLPPT
ncbi:MAG TPA: hypothetical protein VMI75_26545 [Polyangiaceae bacterium]|nr:hypothetical protein [Polyangiaceae bacterium]